MKIKLDELKKAIQWIETNTTEINVGVYIDPKYLQLKCFDRLESEVTIKLFRDEIQVIPKITKTEMLK